MTSIEQATSLRVFEVSSFFDLDRYLYFFVMSIFHFFRIQNPTKSSEKKYQISKTSKNHKKMKWFSKVKDSNFKTCTCIDLFGVTCPFWPLLRKDDILTRPISIIGGNNEKVLNSDSINGESDVSCERDMDFLESLGETFHFAYRIHTHTNRFPIVVAFKREGPVISSLVHSVSFTTHHFFFDINSYPLEGVLPFCDIFFHWVM